MAQTLKIIGWEIPPSTSRGPQANTELLAVLAEVKANYAENRGKWAKIAEGRKDSGLVTRINHGRVAGVAKGEFLAKSRSRTNGTGKVYDIYVQPVVKRGRPKGSTNGAPKPAKRTTKRATKRAAKSAR